MQERQVTIGEHDLSPCPIPFLVMATQNPIEQEGTYPLPEAQVDRFMLKLKVGLSRTATRSARSSTAWRSRRKLPVTPVVTADDIRAGARVVDEIYIDDKIEDYIVDMVLATREPEATSCDAQAPSSNSAPRRAPRST